jgi:hypothetical protein
VRKEIIKTIFNQKFYSYNSWGSFNIKMLFFDGWEYKDTIYRELNLIFIKNKVIVFSDFSEFVPNEIAGGRTLYVNNELGPLVFLNKDGKLFGNEKIGYEWDDWFVSNKGEMSAKCSTGGWYYLHNDGNIEKE